MEVMASCCAYILVVMWWNMYSVVACTCVVGRLTAKSDVYGYGVVLLEILTGRRAVEKSKPIDERNLVDWATPFLNDKSKILRIMDQKLDGQFSQKGAKLAAKLAVHCLQEDAKLRPTMKQVLDFIEPLSESRVNSATAATSPFHIHGVATALAETHHN